MVFNVLQILFGLNSIVKLPVIILGDFSFTIGDFS